MDRSIVVAIAEEPASREALRLGVCAARQLHLPLVVGAVAIGAQFVPAVPAGWIAESVDPDAIRAVLREHLDALAAEVPDDVPCATVPVIARSVAAGIEDLAEQNGAELIVLGSSRYGLVGRLVEGDPALGVIRHTTCTVLIAAPHDDSVEASRRPAAEPRIGVAWDRSEPAALALASAAEAASRLAAPLHVVHVLEPVMPLLTLPEDPAVGRHLAADRREAAADAIRAATRDLACPVEIEIREGHPSDELDAATQDLDVLFVGSRRQGPARRLLSGSVSRHLVHHAHCAVAVVAPPVAVPAHGPASGVA